MRTVTHSEWEKEAILKFGDNLMDWKFVCPSCGHVASAQDWKDAGAPGGAVAFSCVGRYNGCKNAASKTFKLAGGPCDYAGGGLVGLNPVTVLCEGQAEPSIVFEFASDPAFA